MDIYWYLISLFSILGKGQYKLNSNNQYIKNLDVPSCNACKYYHNISGIDNYEISKCSKFGEKDILNGKIKFSYTEMARYNDNLCGYDAKHFELKN
jgi:hypothetical protein